jgi:hypothetical protein
MQVAQALAQEGDSDTAYEGFSEATFDGYRSGSLHSLTPVAGQRSLPKLSTAADILQKKQAENSKAQESRVEMLMASGPRDVKTILPPNDSRSSQELHVQQGLAMALASLPLASVVGRRHCSKQE